MYDGTTVPDGVAAAGSKDSFILKMSNLLPHHQVNALKASLRLSDAQDFQHHTAPSWCEEQHESWPEGITRFALFVLGFFTFKGKPRETVGRKATGPVLREGSRVAIG